MLRYALLGLLSAEPRYGYELKAVFEELLGGTWPLNIGQVYTTLARLERDGLVRCEVVPQDLLPDRKVYFLTPEGETELQEWLSRPTQGPIHLREELFIKVLVASVAEVGGPGSTEVGAPNLIAAQRREHVQALAQIQRLRQDPALPRPTALLLEAAALRAEADLKWLAVCEREMGDRKRDEQL